MSMVKTTIILFNFSKRVPSWGPRWSGRPSRTLSVFRPKTVLRYYEVCGFAVKNLQSCPWILGFPDCLTWVQVKKGLSLYRSYLLQANTGLKFQPGPISIHPEGNFHTFLSIFSKEIFTCHALSKETCSKNREDFVSTSSFLRKKMIPCHFH